MSEGVLAGAFFFDKIQYMRREYFQIMSEQKGRFTKVSGGKYLSEEVDRYIEIVSSAYSEALEELEKVKEQNLKDSENFKQEQEKTAQTLVSERKTSQKEIAELNESLKSERMLKEEALAKANDIENTKVDNTGDIEKISQALEAEKAHKSNLQKELAEAQSNRDRLQSQLAKAQEDNAKLQQEKATLKATMEHGSLGNAGNYIDLLTRTSDMADTYVRDIEDRMNQLEAQANVKADEQLSQAREQAINVVSEAKAQSTKIIDEATSKADTMIKKAEAKRQEILTRTRTEYEGIRGLIEQASKEYASIATNAKEEDIEWDS